MVIEINSQEGPFVSTPAPSGLGSGVGSWLQEHWYWIALAVLAIVLVVVLILLSKKPDGRRLQRDAIERARVHAKEAALALRTRPRRLILTGAPADPERIMGIAISHNRNGEFVIIWFRHHWWKKPRPLVVIDVDLPGVLDARELHVRAIDVRYAEGIFFAVPDPHDPQEW